MTQFIINIRNPFTVEEKKPPIYTWKGLCRAYENSPKMQKIAGAVQEKFFNYAMQKAMSNTDYGQLIGNRILEQLEQRGIPALEVKEVAEVIFAGIKAGLNR